MGVGGSGVWTWDFFHLKPGQRPCFIRVPVVVPTKLVRKRSPAGPGRRPIVRLAHDRYRSTRYQIPGLSVRRVWEGRRSLMAVFRRPSPTPSRTNGYTSRRRPRVVKNDLRSATHTYAVWIGCWRSLSISSSAPPTGKRCRRRRIK